MSRFTVFLLTLLHAGLAQADVVQKSAPVDVAAMVLVDHPASPQNSPQASSAPEEVDSWLSRRDEVKQTWLARASDQCCFVVGVPRPQKSWLQLRDACLLGSLSPLASVRFQI